MEKRIEASGEKQPEDEKPRFREIRGGLIERFQDRFKKHPDTVTVTSFGGGTNLCLNKLVGYFWSLGIVGIGL